MKSTDSKHYIVIPYHLFEQYMIIGQRYYIEKRNWTELTKFTCAMLDCCGYVSQSILENVARCNDCLSFIFSYVGIGRLDFLSHTNRFQYMKEQRNNIRLDPDDQIKETATETSNDHNEPQQQQPEDLLVLVAFMCEFAAAAGQFIQFGYDYYKAVCAVDDGKEEKSCLIPICAIQPSFAAAIKPESPTKPASSSNESPPTTSQESNVRKRTAAERDAENDRDNTGSSSERQSKKIKLDNNLPDRGEGLNAYCMRGVDEALQILSKAADCMRHLVDLWQWGSITSPRTNWNTVFLGWEQELCRIIDAYKLPFDICNAVLLVRSDLALSSVRLFFFYYLVNHLANVSFGDSHRFLVILPKPWIYLRAFVIGLRLSEGRKRARLKSHRQSMTYRSCSPFVCFTILE